VEWGCRVAGGRSQARKLGIRDPAPSPRSGYWRTEVSRGWLCWWHLRCPRSESWSPEDSMANETNAHNEGSRVEYRSALHLPLGRHLQRHLLNFPPHELFPFSSAHPAQLTLLGALEVRGAHSLAGSSIHRGARTSRVA
jgi:hypothetical protein